MPLYKFYLRPGEMSPAGTTSIAMLDGGIVWEGEKWTADKLVAHEMSEAEAAEYKALLNFIKMETEFRIEFADVWPKNDSALATKMSGIKTKLDAIASADLTK